MALSKQEAFERRMETFRTVRGMIGKPAIRYGWWTVTFVENQERGWVDAVVTRQVNRRELPAFDIIGSSIQGPHDEWNLWEGRRVALGRALKAIQNDYPTIASLLMRKFEEMRDRSWRLPGVLKSLVDEGNRLDQIAWDNLRLGLRTDLHSLRAEREGVSRAEAKTRNLGEGFGFGTTVGAGILGATPPARLHTPIMEAPLPSDAIPRPAYHLGGTPPRPEPGPFEAAILAGERAWGKLRGPDRIEAYADLRRATERLIELENMGRARG